MLSAIKQMLGLGPETDYKKLVSEGAVILDVRSKGEYATGHVKGSINIPVGDLSNQLRRLPDREKPIITCCASGMRSSSARSILESKGYKHVYNGGGWMSLKMKINEQ